jgi:hypothetical protein
LKKFADDMSIIQSIWDDLGVDPRYKLIFSRIAVQLDESLSKDFLEFELSSLRKYSGTLSVIISFIFLNRN